MNETKAGSSQILKTHKNRKNNNSLSDLNDVLTPSGYLKPNDERIDLQRFRTLFPYDNILNTNSSPNLSLPVDSSVLKQQSAVFNEISNAQSMAYLNSNAKPSFKSSIRNTRRAGSVVRDAVDHESE